MRILWFIAFVCLILLPDASATVISCESIHEYYIASFSTESCWMTEATSINSTGVEIEKPASDIVVTGLTFYDNKKIFFLPEKVAAVFPNLIVYMAADCSITEISKNHFDGMRNLKGLYLSDNQIEKIRSNTFEDLISLQRIELYGNRLKFANGKLFDGLNSIEHANFGSNVCISETFGNNADVMKALSEKCEYVEEAEFFETSTLKATPKTGASECVCNDDSKKMLDELKNLFQVFMNNTLVENKNCLIELGKAKSELNAEKEINEVMKIVKAKTEEITALLNQMENKNAEINAKNEENKRLKEKVEILSRSNNQ